MPAKPKVKKTTNDELPGLLKEQLTNGTRYQEALVRDLTECVKEKAVADRLATNWDETVEQLVRKCVLLGCLHSDMVNAGLRSFDDLSVVKGW